LTEDGQRDQLVRALTTAAMLVYAGWVLWLFDVVDRASRVGASRVGGVWEQRIEALGFIALPPHVPVLGMAAIAVCAATLLAGDAHDLSRAIVLRLVRWSATAIAVIGATSVLSVLLGEPDGPGRLGTVSFRTGGVFMAAAIAYFTRTVEQSTPSG